MKIRNIPTVVSVRRAPEPHKVLLEDLTNRVRTMSSYLNHSQNPQLVVHKGIENSVRNAIGDQPHRSRPIGFERKLKVA